MRSSAVSPLLDSLAPADSLAPVDSLAPADSLALVDHRLVVGIGARRQVGIRDVRPALSESLAVVGAHARDVVALVTVETQQPKEGLLELAELLGVPLRLVPVEVLAGQPAPNRSAVADRLIGTPSVAEAAVLALGAELVAPKRISHGVVIAIGRLPGVTPAPVLTEKSS